MSEYKDIPEWVRIHGWKILNLFLLCLISYFLTFKGFLNNNPDFMLYLSSAVIQSYAAIITIFLTISTIHLSKMYGSIVVNILLKESKKIFCWYLIIVIVSVANIILNPNTVLVPNIPELMLFIMLTSQLAVTLIPIYPLLKKLEDLLKISPPDVMRSLGYPEKIQKLVSEGKLSEAWDRLFKGQSLIRSCIIDSSLRDYLGPTLDLYSKTINGFHWPDKKIGEWTEDEGMRLLIKITDRLDEYIVLPLENVTYIGEGMAIMNVVWSLTHVFIKTYDSSTYKSGLNDYLKEILNLVETFFKKGKFKYASSLFYRTYAIIKEESPLLQKNFLRGYLPQYVSKLLLLAKEWINKATNEDIAQLNMNISDIIKENPTIFNELDPESIDAWIDVIKNSPEISLGYIDNALKVVRKYGGNPTRISKILLEVEKRKQQFQY